MATKAQRRRARWVKAAHRAGLTFEGYRFWKSGGSRSLAERTSGSLRKQAAREMNEAYAPVEQSFTRREQQVRELDAKQQADEAAFGSWLAQQQATIRQEQDTRIAATRSLAEGHQADLQNRVNELAQERARVATEVGGATAPRSQAAQAAETAVIATAARNRTTLEGNLARSTDLTSAVSANNFAFLASNRSKRQAKTLDALAEVAGARDKALLQRAADSNRRVAALLDGEVQKAQLRIASQEFSTKEANDLLDAARGRSVSRDKTAATREGQKETTRRAGQQPAPVPSYTRDEWNRHSSSWRKRKLKEYEAQQKKDKGKDKGGDPSGRANKRQIAAAQNEVANARQYASGVVRPPQGDADKPWPWPPPKVGPGKALVLSRWLQRNWQWNKNKADVVAWQVAYKYRGKGPMPKGIRDRFYNYAATLPS